ETTVRFARVFTVILGIPFFVAPARARAQTDRPAVPSHSDPVVQGVQKHINALCEAHDARLAAVDDPEKLARELDTSRRRFLELLDLDLERPRAAPRITPAGTLEFAEY